MDFKTFPVFECLLSFYIVHPDCICVLHTFIENTLYSITFMAQLLLHLLSILAGPTSSIGSTNLFVQSVEYRRWLLLHFILKGSSLYHNPFEGFTLQSESLEVMKGVGDKKTIPWNALLCHLANQLRRCLCHAIKPVQGIIAQSVSLKSFIPKGHLMWL